MPLLVVTLEFGLLLLLGFIVSWRVRNLNSTNSTRLLFVLVESTYLDI